MELNSSIPIERLQFGGGTSSAVSARHIHASFGVKEPFANWIKRQVASNRFSQGTDYIIFKANLNKPGRPRIEYALTLDAAKKLAIESDMSKAGEVRDYFLTVEKRAASLPDFSNPATAARAWADQYEQRETLSCRCTELEGTVAELDDMVSRQSKTIRELNDGSKHMQEELHRLQPASEFADAVLDALRDLKKAGRLPKFNL